VSLRKEKKGKGKASLSSSSLPSIQWLDEYVQQHGDNKEEDEEEGSEDD
jgi:hypothetical protein